MAKLDDTLGHVSLNEMKKWWWDLERKEDGGYKDKVNPDLRIVLMDPFVLPTGPLKNPQAYESRRALTDEMRVVVAKLAKDYGAVHIKTQDIFDAAAKASSPENWIWDGIHPLPAGHELIARHWLQAVSTGWR